MHITEIKSLPIEQRMLLMKQIWDTLCYEDEEIKSPSWHEDIINDRMQSISLVPTRCVGTQPQRAALSYKPQRGLYEFPRSAWELG